MKARYSTTATPVAGWFRYSRTWVVVLLSPVLIGIVLASTLYRAQTLAPVTAPTTENAATLDQHERHPNLFAPTIESAATLDQHERHPNLAPKAANAALPDPLARWLAARNR